MLNDFKLKNLKKKPGYPFYQLIIGKFHICIYTNADYSLPANKEYKSFLDYKAVSFAITEIDLIKDKINILKDERFRIFLEENRWSYSDYHIATGYLIPTDKLLLLLSYISKLEELRVFS